MQKAFVTGGSGFLALNLIHELLGDGWSVVAFDLDPSRIAKLDSPQLSSSRLQVVQGDVTDAASCKRAMPEGIDAVFHVAANTSHWKLGDALQTKVNVGGTRVVVEAALARRARRFVHTSSIAAFGFHPARITEEMVSTAPGSSINYFRTKHAAELEVRRGIENGLDAVILNPANIIGRYDSGGWSRFFPLIQNGRLPGVPPGKASFCHAREVARAHVAAFDNGRCGHNYLLGGADATFLEVVGQIGEIVGHEVPNKPTPAAVSKILARVLLWSSYVTRTEPVITPEKATLLSAELICSSKKAQTELGYTPTTLREMLDDCWEWMLEEGEPASGAV